MGLFNFSALRSALGDVKTRIKDLDKDIDDLTKQRNDMASLPLPYDDFAEWAVARLDSIGEGYIKDLRSNLLGESVSMKQYFMSERNSHEVLEHFRASFNRVCHLPFEKPNFYSDKSEVAASFFIYCLGDTIKAGLRKALDETVKPKWPKVVGLPRAERITKLEALERKLSEVIEERAKISDELSGVVA